ncbi:MAG TPA: hypothetical protein VKZ68_10495 [Ohtaekwangia sp.]|nr:hypothetical protein [Ohtaekwangia sp.]
MATLEELKKHWQSRTHSAGQYDLNGYKQLIQHKMKKQQNAIFKYFWGTFVFHLIVYAMLTHVLVRFWSDDAIVIASLIGLLVTIPFTAVMIRRFSRMASDRFTGNDSAIVQFITRQRDLLAGYFAFKKRYEWMMIPLQCAVGVFIVYHLFMPGGVPDHPLSATIVFALSVISCIAAIRIENKKNFAEPLLNLNGLIKELGDGAAGNEVPAE